MRPLFWVRHSPRLTNRNGVLARMAPPSTASGTPHHPSASISRGPLLEDAKPPVQGLAGQDDQEDDSPHDQNGGVRQVMPRSEEHTSELQSRPHLVCRLLLEKKKK